MEHAIGFSPFADNIVCGSVKLAVCWDYCKVFAGLINSLGNLGISSKDVSECGACALSKNATGISLKITVNQKHALVLESKSMSQIHCECAFPSSPLHVEDTDSSLHAFFFL